MPGLAREVLQRDVLQLRALPNEQLGDAVEVAGEPCGPGRILLDERKARAFLGNDQQLLEERSVLDCVDDADEQRPLELEPAGHVHE